MIERRAAPILDQTPGGHFRVGDHWQDIWGQPAEIVAIRRLPWCGRPNSSHAVKWSIELRWLEWPDYPTTFETDLTMRCDWIRAIARSQHAEIVAVSSRHETRRPDRLPRRAYRRSKRQRTVIRESHPHKLDQS
jgi:hypothetical protein